MLLCVRKIKSSVSLKRGKYLRILHYFYSLLFPIKFICLIFKNLPKEDMSLFEKYSTHLNQLFVIYNIRGYTPGLQRLSYPQ